MAGTVLRLRFQDFGQRGVLTSFSVASRNIEGKQKRCNQIKRLDPTVVKAWWGFFIPIPVLLAQDSGNNILRKVGAPTASETW
jgi:hypothetical protein